MKNNATSFQRDINIAIAWWLDTGIYFKMEADITSEYGSQRTFWTRPKVRGDQPLSFSHVLPSFIIFGVATCISMVAFALEIFQLSTCRCTKEKGEEEAEAEIPKEVKRAEPNRSTAAPNMPRKGHNDLEKCRPRKSEGSSRTHPQ